MHFAVEGCCHGDLNKIYTTLLYAIEQKTKENQILLNNTESNSNIDFLLVCGDFQSIRNETDLQSMSVPKKYLEMKDFHEYFYPKQQQSSSVNVNTSKLAPIPTLFIGGNHESSLYLLSLPFGGYVTKKIFYLGHCGFIQIKNSKNKFRIGGWSGIFKEQDFFKDSTRFILPDNKNTENIDKLNRTVVDEMFIPFSENAKKSIYHLRLFEFFKILNMKVIFNELEMLELDNNTNDNKFINIFMTHDWPTGVTKFGDLTNIKKYKDHLMKEINETNHKLGNPFGEYLLCSLKPDYWFSAHLHTKFSAVIPFGPEKNCKFLALDKCLPKRDFLQIVTIDNTNDKNSVNKLLNEEENELYYDIDWLVLTKLFYQYRFEFSNLLKQQHLQKLENLPSLPNMLDSNIKSK
ncbi:hypothetical protein ABK040_001095 [Willaertia magna]